MARNLIFTGDLKAQCVCGEWHYQGILAEARRAIERVYESHAWACKLKKSATLVPTKKRRKSAR